MLRRLELTDGERYHPGGISRHGRSLWVPVAEMKPDSSAVLEEIDTETVQVRRRIHVADHLGCVAVSDTKLIADNWDSRLLYSVDLHGGDRVRVVANPSGTPFQDIKVVGDQLVGAGALTLWSGTIGWIDLATMRARPHAARRRDRPCCALYRRGHGAAGPRSLPHLGRRTEPPVPLSARCVTRAARHCSGLYRLNRHVRRAVARPSSGLPDAQRYDFLIS